MSKQKIVTGVVKRHPDGFGFLVPDDPKVVDVYIPRHEMKGVMTNDRIEITLQREPGGKRWRGELRKVLARATTKVVGRYEVSGKGEGRLRDQSFSWGEDLLIVGDAGEPAKDGDWVAVQIASYPDSEEGLTGKIVAIIGDLENPQNDSLRVLHGHHIPFEFSSRTLAEINKLPSEVSERDWQGRRDLQDISLITIDGKTAKDFDDAIFVETTSEGFHLVVAIADVSHYVKPGTALDDDAYQRGTSTYFPNFVAPMLPEKLSNELCSLKPNVPRLAFVADMLINFQGEQVRREFYEAVIKSRARVTYGEAQEVLDGSTPDKLRPVEKMIRQAGDLAKILMTKRFKDGSIDLEIPETEITLDDTGQPVDIIQSERLFAHRLIEELMLSANVAVARELKQRGVPTLFRVHEEPRAEAMKALEEYLETLGSRCHLSGAGLQKKITRALEAFDGHVQEHVLHVLTLRSMAQARYSPEDLGHFGLGFADYAHFTSPIRRYPDLIVHRQLKSALYKQKGYARQGAEELESAGTVLSACEQRSVKAERHVKAIKKARFMAAHLGEEFSGMISSVTKFGVFVVLRQFDVDGLIRLEDLGGDHFEFDDEKLWLIGKRSGHTIKIGDPIQVVVAAADPQEGRVDFVPADMKKVERAQLAHQKNTAPAQRPKGAHHPKRVRKTRFPSGRRKGKARKFHP